MKKQYFFLLLFFVCISIFFNCSPVSAKKSVKITYNRNNGVFSKKSNSSKNKVIITHKKGVKRGYAPSIKRSNYTFDGWFSKKKKGKKYTYNTKIKKNTKLYPHWIKRYKIQKKYYSILSTTYLSLEQLTDDIGLFYYKKQWNSFDQATVSTKNDDLFLLNLGINYSIEPNTYKYHVQKITTQIKRIIQTKKNYSKNIFLKKLGKKKYDCNYNKRKHILTVIKGNTTYSDPTTGDAGKYYISWKIFLTKKNKIFPNSKVILTLHENNEI